MYKKISIASIKPTEPLLPQDKLDEIKEHYDGTIDSIAAIHVVEHNGEYYPENGNKRTYFLHTNGHNEINAFVDYEPWQEDLEWAIEAAEKCRRLGVHSFRDLTVLSREKYDEQMREYDLID